MDIYFFLSLLVLGAIIGFLAGLLGIGGGMIMIPFITTLLDRSGVAPLTSFKIAIATALATIIFTSVSSLRAHHQHGAIRWDIFRAMSPGIVVGGLLSAQLASALKGPWLYFAFVIFVGISATKMLFPKKAAAAGQLPGKAMLSAVGALFGAIAALAGAGGAVLTIPYMTLRSVSMHHAVATSAALGLPIALAGTVGYMLTPTPSDLPANFTLAGYNGMIGLLHLPTLFSVVASSVLTAPLGAKVAHRLPTQTLRRYLACFLYGIAGYMLYRGLNT